jgi:hypothetical protein
MQVNEAKKATVESMSTDSREEIFERLELRAETLDNMEGELSVLRDLLRIAVRVLDNVEPESTDESKRLRDLVLRIDAALIQSEGLSETRRGHFAIEADA